MCYFHRFDVMPSCLNKYIDSPMSEATNNISTRFQTALNKEHMINVLLRGRISVSNTSARFARRIFFRRRREPVRRLALFTLQSNLKKFLETDSRSRLGKSSRRRYFRSLLVLKLLLHPWKHGFRAFPPPRQSADEAYVQLTELLHMLFVFSGGEVSMRMKQETRYALDWRLLTYWESESHMSHLFCIRCVYMLRKKPRSKTVERNWKKKALLCIVSWLLPVPATEKPVSSFSIIQFQHFSVALNTVSLICLSVKRTHLTLAR